MMKSYCINHQYSAAVNRCSCCLKPLCETCSLITDDGVFCGEECRAKRVAAVERLAMFKSREEQHRGNSWVAWVVRMVRYAVIGAVIYGVWPYLPDAITLPLVKTWYGVLRLVGWQ